VTNHVYQLGSALAWAHVWRAALLTLAHTAADESLSDLSCQVKQLLNHYFGLTKHRQTQQTTYSSCVKCSSSCLLSGDRCPSSKTLAIGRGRLKMVKPAGAGGADTPSVTARRRFTRFSELMQIGFRGFRYSLSDCTQAIYTVSSCRHDADITIVRFPHNL